MSIRFIHTADIQFDTANQEAALKSLTALAETAELERPAFVIIAGDLFNRSVALHQSHPLFTILRRIRDVCPIFAVGGTETHDIPGCYAPLEAAGLVRMVTPENAVIYKETLESEPLTLILGCPEPGKEWFLAGANGVGKEEADRRVVEGMRKILLGLGALRAEHPELPCVMLYHGGVAGASMANGQLVEGGITIGREDLALVGADYYALGHIHEWQQIEGMPAYYTGSAYPVNWGEVTQKRFNLIEIDNSDNSIEVTPIYFPHPPRKKVITNIGDVFPPDNGETIKGFQTWMVLRGTKEQLSDFDLKKWERIIEIEGTLPGSRVTTEIIPVETVRAAQITEKHRLRDKLAVHAEASDINQPAESVLEKADALEREAEARGVSVEGAHIRLRKLRLRGAIGIHKGLGLDEIVLDFDRYDAGLLALTWKNGSGKTTLIENCHPYAEMLTRAGSLQDHFRLRDSARELWFADERTGTEYRALILIDGKNTSGSCEYHLFKYDGKMVGNGDVDFDWIPLTNGRKADYEEKIAALFGSLPLFLRSAFVSQKATKNNPDLADATKGEKKELFRELAGLDYLQDYTESAKEKAGKIEGEIEIERGRVNLIESQLEALPGIREERRAGGLRLESMTADLAVLEAKGKAAKVDAEATAKHAEEQRALGRRIEDLRERKAEQERTAGTAREQVEGYRKAAAQKGAAERIIDAHGKLTLEEKKENERITTVLAEHSRIRTEYADALKAHQENERKLEGQRTTLRTDKAALEADHRVLQVAADRLSEDLEKPLNENCPTCGQVLPPETLARLRDKRAEDERKKLEIEQKIEVFSPQITQIEREIMEILEGKPPAEPDDSPVDDSKLKNIRRQLEILNIEGARRVLVAAQEAATRTEELARQILDAERAVQDLGDEIKTTEEQLDPGAEEARQRAEAALEEARRAYNAKREEIARQRATIEALDGRITELEAQERDLAERKTAIEGRQHEAGEWRYLERACGPDGIQALELDALGPGIAEIANRLLSSAYGARFSIEFRTTRIAGKGSKTKQVEDFSIWSHDAEGGTEQELSTLSGGESVWVKYAIYSAFGLIRARSAGTRFLTCFQDEADGALDPEARLAYFAMLQAAHQESGRRHTVIITHSPEIQEMIAQKIEAADIAAKAPEAAAA